MSLAKIALNRLKMHNLAKEVGLHEKGNWKWGVKQLTDNKGNALQGRELAQAKEGLGKLPNNVRQKVQSVARAAGNNKEVGLVGTAQQPLTQLAKQPIARGKVGNSIDPHTGEYRESTRRVGPFAIGDNNSVDPFDGFVDYQQPIGGDRYKGLGQVTHDVHTHPFVANPNRHLSVEQRTAQLRRKMEERNIPRSIIDYEMPTRKRLIEESQEAKTSGPGLVRPSGYHSRTTLPGQYQGYADYRGLDEAIRQIHRSEGGDYGFDLQKYLFNPSSKSNIYDPLFGNEAVHVTRPWGYRSLYFKNKGQYDPAVVESPLKNYTPEELEAKKRALFAQPERPAPSLRERLGKFFNRFRGGESQ